MHDDCQMKLADLKPCATGLASAREYRTLRDAWDAASSSDLMWLIGKAYTVGTLPRRALVLVAVRCAETCANLIAVESLPHLATVASWASGDDDITQEDLQAALASSRAADRDAFAAYAAYNANADAVAAAAAVNAAAVLAATTVANVANFADYAAYAAYTAQAAAQAAAAADYAAADALGDVIRDAITLETVCAALGLDPDEVIGFKWRRS